MPQMSPIGWSWIVFFVIFGYTFFFVIFYYFFLLYVSLGNFSDKGLNYIWMW
uniref:ATP synthase F0 subunit 8 n=1 Tax=Scorpiops jendeki TaxID=587368 RepID=UPI0023D83CE8|nr:ATP synthase F0 subunit 8 [Scorpiops jendeki]WDA95739.1 ATP synthase F0 subunit 8 [Scorpiops jendeki]